MRKTILSVLFTAFSFSVLAIPVSAESTAGVLPHKTDFLNLPVCFSTTGTWCGTTWYVTHSATQRATYRSQIKSKGYTHIYVSVTNKKQYNFYDGGVAEFKGYLQEIVNDGLKPIVFLTSDSDGQTGLWSQQTTSAIIDDLNDFIPQIDSLVNSYVLGIEMDEYWTLSKSDEIGNHLDNELTSKPLAAHQLPKKYDYCTGWCDYMLLQTNNPATSTTTTAVKNSVLEARNGLNKPVVAAEYNLGEENIGISLGTAAQEVCAAGFGNGGNSSSVEWPGCEGGGTITPTPTSPPNTPTSGEIPGDANGDDAVDIKDYVYWVKNFSKNLTGASNGDFNNNGKIDGLDYIIWMKNYTTSTSTPTPAR